MNYLKGEMSLHVQTLILQGYKGATDPLREKAFFKGLPELTRIHVAYEKLTPSVDSQRC